MPAWQVKADQTQCNAPPRTNARRKRSIIKAVPEPILWGSPNTLALLVFKRTYDL